MIRLMREVRFFAQEPAGSGAQPERANTWAGTAGPPRLPFWTVRVAVEGPVDSRTGYLCDIKTLDDLVRRWIAPRLWAVPAGSDLGAHGGALQRGVAAAAAVLGPPLRLAFAEGRLSPHTFFTAYGGSAPMLTLTQSYEFSASHRLQVPGLSDEENRRLFGKCSNPHGHGHNYVLEVTVPCPEESRFDLGRLDDIVRRCVIEPLDHKNLNVECPEFATLNPTVENIARVIHDRLARELSTANLCGVRVWETAKTYAECRGGDRQ